jgi:hypothetical protein
MATEELPYAAALTTPTSCVLGSIFDRKQV